MHMYVYLHAQIDVVHCYIFHLLAYLTIPFRLKFRKNFYHSNSIL
jgi:hypothetical protein